MLKQREEEIVIIGAARTPIGAYLGDLKTVPVERLGEISLQGAIERSGVSKDEIEEVIVGNVIGSQTSNNLGRIIGLNVGLPVTSTGMTVNRICGSGMQSAVSACFSLLFSDKKVVAAGGVESLSRAPYYLPESVRYEGFRMGDQSLIDSQLAGLASASGRDLDIPHMGNTAENVARRYGITRQRADLFALHSQRKAAQAMSSGRLAEEIVPVEVTGKKGKVTIVDTDGHPRPDTTLEALSRLKSAFEENGIVTAGNASGMNDGACFELFTTVSYAKEKGYPFMARVVDFEITGCDPAYMGLGPVFAIRRLLERQQMTLENDIDILEINEAFASQTIGCLIELGIEEEGDYYKKHFNPNGGAIALGHPLGMSGARLITSLVYEFKNHPEKRFGLASACIGGGQGIAILLENGSFLQ